MLEQLNPFEPHKAKCEKNSQIRGIVLAVLSLKSKIPICQSKNDKAYFEQSDLKYTQLLVCLFFFCFFFYPKYLGSVMHRVHNENDGGTNCKQAAVDFSRHSQ